MTQEMPAGTSPSSSSQASTQASTQATSTQATSTQATSTQANLPLLRNGSRGDAVTLLQDLLLAQSYRPGVVDGIFGPTTEQAVRTFQKNFGLTQDGVVGSKTWLKLGDRFINP
ncbi:MAG: peptidoglycan-binding protein [Oculatellaceae cyanobacterium Prado106]|nr:peptidoglycan-binding protein [Oculatellaceae cyanobacterium Prado106]